MESNPRRTGPTTPATTTGQVPTFQRHDEIERRASALRISSLILNKPSMCRALVETYGPAKSKDDWLSDANRLVVNRLIGRLRAAAANHESADE